MTFPEFVKDFLSDSDPEPFCPLNGIYCTFAYSHWCYNCEIAKDYAEHCGIETEGEEK